MHNKLKSGVYMHAPPSTEGLEDLNYRFLSGRTTPRGYGFVWNFKLSPNQLLLIDYKLNSSNVSPCLCYGAHSAILSSLEKGGLTKTLSFKSSIFSFQV